MRPDHKEKNKYIGLKIRSAVTAMIMAASLVVPCLTAYGSSATPATVNTGNTPAVTSNPSSTYKEEGTEGVPANDGERYNEATTTNPFLMPGNTWVTPEAVHGQDMILVLPVVNMFKYNITDVIITPRLGAKTDDFPFEISNTGYTEKIDLLLGEDAQPNYADRVVNCVWVFKTRENVKTGYYKIDFDITYTDPTCAVDTTVISVYVKTTGLPENGTTDGDENKKLSTPRLIVKGYSTSPGEIFSGSQFTLNLVVQNTSKEVTIKNLQMDLTATVEGSQTQASYAAFLPTSGSNSFYVDAIPPNGEKELSMDFEAKAGLEQKPYVMDIAMKYEDDRANPYEGKGSISIPVKQVSKFDISTPTIEPATVDIGEQANLMFSIYNTGKTTLYNVQVKIIDSSIEPALAYAGNLAPGATGNIDLMLTGKAVTTSPDGMIPVQISYEDETGSTSYEERRVSLFVQEPVIEDFEMAEEETSEEKTIPLWVKIAAGVAGGLILIILVVVIIKKLGRRKKKNEEDMLAQEIDYEIASKNGKGE